MNKAGHKSPHTIWFSVCEIILEKAKLKTQKISGCPISGDWEQKLTTKSKTGLFTAQIYYKSCNRTCKMDELFSIQIISQLKGTKKQQQRVLKVFTQVLSCQSVTITNSVIFHI